MKPKALLMALAAGLAITSPGLEGVRTDGAARGEWTHDVDAARLFAGANGRYLFVDFTGSDWCGWCQLMDEHVFTQPGWKAFASEFLSLAYVDTPRDASRVPEKYRARNAELRKKHGINGFPTYLLFAPDGHLAGRLGAVRGGTDMGFVTNVVTLIVEDRFAEFMSPEERETYKTVQREREAWEAENGRAQREFRFKHAEPHQRELAEIDRAKLEILRRAAAKSRAEAKPNPSHVSEIVFSNYGRGVMTNGASFGSWTCDFEAAKKLAGESGRDMLIAFTGPGWCKWGNMMESNVFNTVTWMNWASDNLVQVYVDCPDEKNSLGLPEPILERNAALYKRYGMQGCPFYLLTDPDGNRYDAFGGSSDATPEAEIEAVELLMARHRLGKLVSAEDLAEYKRLVEREDALAEEWRSVYDAFIATMNEQVERLKPISEKRDALFMKAFDAWCAENGAKFRAAESAK